MEQPILPFNELLHGYHETDLLDYISFTYHVTEMPIESPINWDRYAGDIRVEAEKPVPNLPWDALPMVARSIDAFWSYISHQVPKRNKRPYIAQMSIEQLFELAERCTPYAQRLVDIMPVNMPTDTQWNKAYTIIFRGHDTYELALQSNRFASNMIILPIFTEIQSAINSRV